VGLPQHPGTRVCVMGGGAGLAADLERVGADNRVDLWISSNHHGAALRQVDYVVALDERHSRLHVPMRALIRAHTAAPIIAPWADELQGDIVLSGWPLALNYTGPVACWVADRMGAAEIVLAGFDCYGGKASAVDLHRRYVSHIRAAVRVVSGPLLELYPADRVAAEEESAG
jgi:hypothetical protein